MGEVLPGHLVRPTLPKLQLPESGGACIGISYNFSPSFVLWALTSLLQEHIVQWHPTILTKLALVPQHLINSYGVDIASRGGKEVMHKEGEFVVRLVGCELDSARYCEKEFDQYYQQWKALQNKGSI